MGVLVDLSRGQHQPHRPVPNALPRPIRLLHVLTDLRRTSPGVIVPVRRSITDHSVGSVVFRRRQGRVIEPLLKLPVIILDGCQLKLQVPDLLRDRSLYTLRHVGKTGCAVATPTSGGSYTPNLSVREPKRSVLLNRKIHVFGEREHRGRKVVISTEGRERDGGDANTLVIELNARHQVPSISVSKSTIEGRAGSTSGVP